jgi:hypothetical protein
VHVLVRVVNLDGDEKAGQLVFLVEPFQGYVVGTLDLVCLRGLFTGVPVGP